MYLALSSWDLYKVGLLGPRAEAPCPLQAFPFYIDGVFFCVSRQSLRMVSKPRCSLLLDIMIPMHIPSQPSQSSPLFQLSLSCPHLSTCPLSPDPISLLPVKSPHRHANPSVPPTSSSPQNTLAEHHSLPSSRLREGERVINVAYTTQNSSSR